MATDLTRTHDVFENAVCLEEQVFACLEAYGTARKRVDEIEVGKMSVEEFRDSGKHLARGRFFDKDSMEHPVLRVGLWVLSYASPEYGPLPIFIVKSRSLTSTLPSTTSCIRVDLCTQMAASRAKK